MWSYWNKNKFIKCQPQKIVKHTQTICRQQLTNCLSVFGHFAGLPLKGLTLWYCKRFNRFHTNVHRVKNVQIWSFLSLFSRVWTKCGDLLGKSLYLVWIRENTDRKKLHIWTLLTYCLPFISTYSVIYAAGNWKPLK